MEEKTALAPIIERNRDVEHVMLAACRYGHHGLGVKNKDKRLSLLAVTDVHGSETQMRSAIAYLNHYDAFDGGICLGDIMPAHFNSPADWYVDAVLSANKPFYTVLGNHDHGNSADATLAATPKMAFDKFIAPTREKMEMPALDQPYYCKLFEKYGVALVVLNGNDTPDGTDEKGNYKIHRGVEMYGQAQIDWLVRTLAEIPEGYHLLLASHTFLHAHDVVECAFSQKGKRLNWSHSGNPYHDTELLTDIIHAWTCGTRLSGVYTPIREDLPAITVDVDFSARGEGIFVAHLIGHFHRDTIARSKKYPEQMIVSLISTANDVWQNHACDLPRAAGTKAEDAITAVTVDTGARELRLVRIGSNMTMDLTERTYIALPY